MVRLVPMTSSEFQVYLEEDIERYAQERVRAGDWHPSEAAQQKIAEPEQAEAIIKEADRVRTTFIESYYGVRWDVASAFDVVIDTGKVAPDLAVAWLADAAKAMQARTAGEARTTSALEVDQILASAVSAVLKCQETH